MELRKKKKISVSVIIPCFNAAKTINRCIDSISLQNINAEIICIDDSSSDNTFKILKELERTNKNLKVFQNKKNFGPGKTRNIGINYASGDYITFVDSDDEIEDGCYKTILENLKDNNIEVLRYLTTNEKIIGTEEKDLISTFFTSKNHLGTFSVCLFIKRELFKNIKFNESIKMMEDSILYFDLIKTAKNFHIADIKGYRYFKNPNGITTSTKKIRGKINDILFVSEYISNRIDDGELKAKINAYHLDIITEQLLAAAKNEKLEYKKVLKNMINDKRFQKLVDNFSSENLSRNKKFFIWTITGQHRFLNTLLINIFGALR